MHALGVVTLHEVDLVAVAPQQALNVIVAVATQHRRATDLVAVEMQNGQHGAVAGRVEETGALPSAGQRPGFRLAVPDHRGDDQVRVVEGRAESMRQHVAKLAALVNRARSRRADVAGDPAGSRETAAQELQSR